MERIQALIRQLKELADRQAEPSQLLSVVNQLQKELAGQQQAPRSLGTSKVAVLMPASMSVPPELAEKYAPKAADAVWTPAPAAQPEPQPEPVPAVHQDGTLDMRFDPMVEIPTLSQQVKSRPELEEGDSPSLNDRLRQSQTELGDRLKDIPIKDLRKAIGINDRFQFINELFRGDEAMYERSIKTINAFSIYPEAEYWISRELKTKLGWLADHPVVHQFDQLIKRRFS
ncbi:MAG: hypothetical protein ACK4E0_16670 [Chitinophagaceae bacterium]